MISIEAIRSDAKKLSSIARKIERFVHGSLFETFYDDCSDEKKKSLQKAIKELDLKTLKDLITDEKDIAEIGVRRLREIARDLKVYNWYASPKCVLIVEIERIRNEKRRNDPRNSEHPQLSLVEELEDAS